MLRLGTNADYTLGISLKHHIVAQAIEITGEFTPRSVKFICYYYIRSYDKISTEFVGCPKSISISLFLDLLCSYSCSGHFNCFDYIAFLVCNNLYYAIFVAGLQTISIPVFVRWRWTRHSPAIYWCNYGRFCVWHFRAIRRGSCTAIFYSQWIDLELYILYVVKYTGLFSTNFIFCDANE